METDKNAKFWNKLAQKYAAQPVKHQAAYQTKLERTQAYLTPDSKLFEFGCGTGSTALFHAPKVAQVLASDLSPEMVQIAQEKALAQGITNVEFQCGAIEDLELEGGSFDVALAMSILHLVQNKDAVLRKIHRALKPGGYLITSTICIAEEFPILRWAAALGSALRLLPQIHCFGETELLESITEAGFHIEEQWKPGPKQALFIIAKKEI